LSYASKQYHPLASDHAFKRRGMSKLAVGVGAESRANKYNKFEEIVNKSSSFLSLISPLRLRPGGQTVHHLKPAAGGSIFVVVRSGSEE